MEPRTVIVPVLVILKRAARVPAARFQLIFPLTARFPLFEIVRNHGAVVAELANVSDPLKFKVSVVPDPPE